MRGLCGALITTLLAVGAALAGPVATAGAAPSSYLKSNTSPSSQMSKIVVHAGTMDRDVPLTILKPKDPSRPRGVLYLMNGAAGGEDYKNWITQTDIVEFMANKNIYVVIPTAGAYTYYTDWEKPDPRLGVNKWSTFLGKELPPIIDAMYKTNGRNAIGGISGSATAALNLAIEHREIYSAVSSFSGCATTSDPIGELGVRAVVEGRGRASAKNMWGPYGGPGWRAHDPKINAERLRGLPLYIATGTGVPGPYDTPQPQRDPAKYQPNLAKLADQIAIGGVIEGGAYACTDPFLQRLRQLNIPATVEMRPVGSHSWGYFQDMFHNAWPFYAKALHA